MTRFIAAPRVGERRSVGRWSKITLLVQVLCVLLFIPEDIAARQTDPTVESRQAPFRFLIGGGLGAANGGIPAFETCGSVNGEFVLTLQGGIRLRRIVQLEGAMLAHMYTGDDCTSVAIGGQGTAAPKEYSGYPVCIDPGSIGPRAWCG